MGFVLTLALWFVGISFGAFFFSNTLLPLIYSLPLSIYYYLTSKGKVSVAVIPVCFVAPVIWITLTAILAGLFALLIPSAFKFVVTNHGFLGGLAFSLLVLAKQLLSRSERAVMFQEYASTKLRRNILCDINDFQL